jgi:hypothetical protein
MDESAFLTEFLAETNLMLTQIDFNSKLYDLIAPIKNHLLKQKELLSFSMARYCGANSQLAFFCEWYYQTLYLTSNPLELVEESRSYFNKKVPIKFRGIPNIAAMVEEDIAIFVPQQLSMLQSKSKAIMDSLVTKQPYLSKYLSDQFLNQVLASVYTTNKRKYVETLNLSEYLEAQSSGTSFVQIALPCLLGFCYNFNQPDSVVRADAVKWVFLEEVLKNISLLHQINQNQKFESFLYTSTMTEKEEFDWMQMNQKNKLQKLMANNEIKEMAHAQKTKIYNSALQALNNLSLPDRHQDMLRELLDWVKMVYVGN